MNWEKIFDRLITYSFYLLFFLIPLALSPLSYELFEFPKMILVYSLTVIITASWLGKMIVRGKIEIPRTPLDLAILFYLFSSVISTIYSLDKHTSFWGYYSRFNGGLISTICYILLFYAFLSNISPQLSTLNFKLSTILLYIYILLGSAFLVSLWGVLEHFGIDAKYWVQDVQNRVFSTLGQPNWLGAFIDALIFIPLAFILQQKKISPLYYILYTLYFLCLIFTNSKSAILAFWLGLTVFIILNAKINKKSFKITLPILIFTLILYTLLGGKTYHYVKKTGSWLKIFTPTPIATPAPLNQKGQENKPFISESSEIRKIVWKGALAIWQHYPLFGSGLETFGYSYYNFRPSEHNLVSEWDFLYNKAHNEFLNILACQGIIGFLSYLSIIIVFIIWTIKNLKLFLRKSRESSTVKSGRINKNKSILNSKFILVSLFVGWLTILITNFFGFSVVITSLLFFVLPAFSFSLFPCKSPGFTYQLTGKKANANTRDLHPWQVIILILLLIAVYSLLISFFKMFRADYFFSQAEKNYQNDLLISSLTNIEKSLQLNPREALYHSLAGRTSAKLAALYYFQDATSSATTIDQLSNFAQSEIDQALRLNPTQLNFYKNKAEIYIFLSYLDPQAKLKALEALSRASQLAPTDAKIFYNLGNLYLQLDDYPQALTNLQKAFQLKPNYRPALLKLAESYQKTGNLDKSKQTLQYILTTIDLEDLEAKKMLEEIDQN